MKDEVVKECALRMKKIRILAFVIAFLTLYGCTIKISRPAKEVELPEYIYQRPENMDYSQASVAIFRFDGPTHVSGLTSVLLPDAGYDAAHRLHQQLMQKGAFLKLIPAYDYEDLNLHEKIELAREKGCDLLITGRVLYYFEGALLSESRVDEEITVIDVKTKKPVWYAESIELGKPIDDDDLLIVIIKGEPAPPASSLLVANAKKFSNMLAEFISQ